MYFTYSQWIGVGLIILLICHEVRWHRQQVIKLKIEKEKGVNTRHVSDKVISYLITFKEKDPNFMFVSNSEQGVLAITTLPAFEAAHRHLRNELAQGTFKIYDRIILKVVPTFTFSIDYRNQRLVHTGSIGLFEKFVCARVFKVIGVDLEKVSSRDRNYFIEGLFRRDERLYIPYCSKESANEEIYKKFGHVYLDQLNEMINQGV